MPSAYVHDLLSTVTYDCGIWLDLTTLRSIHPTEGIRVTHIRTIKFLYYYLVYLPTVRLTRLKDFFILKSRRATSHTTRPTPVLRCILTVLSVLSVLFIPYMVCLSFLYISFLPSSHTTSVSRCRTYPKDPFSSFRCFHNSLSFLPLYSFLPDLTY
jgi:hypothetical protein